MRAVDDAVGAIWGAQGGILRIVPRQSTDRAARFSYHCANFSGSGLWDKICPMAKPGKANQFEQTVVPLTRNGEQPTLTPLSPLTEAERAIFDMTALENPHLRTSDTPLLQAYAMACVRISEPSSRENIAELDRAARLAMSLATKLRLPPSSSIDPVALGRRKKDALTGLKKPWEPQQEGNLDDDSEA